MEELQDAIEDAHYVNEIACADEGPRPVLPWDKPTPEDLEEWKEGVLQRHRGEEKKAGAEEEARPGPEPFTFEWTLSSALGFFLFSAYLKETCHDHVRINFVEEVTRWRTTRGRQRSEKARNIISAYLSPPVLDDETGEAVPPERTEIDEYDLARPVPAPSPATSGDAVKELLGENSDPSCSKCCVGLDGPVLDEIVARVAGTAAEAEAKAEARTGGGGESDEEKERARGGGSDGGAPVPSSATGTGARRFAIDNKELQCLPDDFFDRAELAVAEMIKQEYWESFLGSDEHAKLCNFLWYQDRTVVEEDFFVMRVLGRGGFGLVTACKRGTSGKLYAMKVMNKKRIKMKKAEQLAINERNALSEVESPFVVNLKYSFQSQGDVFLILDLMTGGDLSFHLQQKRRFPKKECLYYAARIMLGLQALHDKQYVYRDLKPENCLLAEDGRVKLTDLGLATKVTPTLHGSAGTRGYWAPEMLRRDKKGKRMPYTQTVDWFSFGCILAEFISGTNPFRSETALNFGLEMGKKTKEKAIDCATLEMDPVFDSKDFDDDAADLCRRLLDKNQKTRLGCKGCEEIMSHPWFRDLNWESIITDRKRPPFVPAKDVNAASQSEIGTFAEDKEFHETVLEDKDEDYYRDWNWTNSKAFQAEVIEFLIYERETGEPLLPQQNGSCCCAIS